VHLDLCPALKERARQGEELAHRIAAAVGRERGLVGIDLVDEELRRVLRGAIQHVRPGVGLVRLHVRDHLPHAGDQRVLLPGLHLQLGNDSHVLVSPFLPLGQRPLNDGARFSRNAARASWWSSLWNVTSSSAVEASKATLSASLISLFTASFV